MKSTGEEKPITEETENLVQELITRLEVAAEVIEDLDQVYDIIGRTYDVTYYNYSCLYRETKHTLRGFSNLISLPIKEDL